MHEIIYNHMNNCENFIKSKMIQVKKIKKLIKKINAILFENYINLKISY